MDFNFLRKIVVCKFNKFIIKGSTTLEISQLSLKLTKEHALFHHRIQTPSRLTDIFKEPEEILKDGNFKENLKTYVSLVSKGKTTFKKVFDAENKIVMGLLKFKQQYWRNLLVNDIHAFIYLTKLLNFNAYERFKLHDKQYELVKIKKEINRAIDTNDRERLKEIIRMNSKISLPILTHVDFCIENNLNDPLIKLDKEYKRMLNYILFEQSHPIDPIDIDTSFFKEVEIFNKFLAGEKPKVIREEFKTVNERGVRDFIEDERGDFI